MVAALLIAFRSLIAIERSLGPYTRGRNTHPRIVVLLCATGASQEHAPAFVGTSGCLWCARSLPQQPVYARDECFH
jgi:hypothetical protein